MLLSCVLQAIFLVLLASCDARRRGGRQRGGNGGGRGNGGGDSVDSRDSGDSGEGGERGRFVGFPPRCPYTCESDDDCMTCNNEESTCDATEFTDQQGNTLNFCTVTGTTTATTCSSNADCPVNTFCKDEACIVVGAGEMLPECGFGIPEPCDTDNDFSCQAGACLQLCFDGVEVCQQPSNCNSARCERLTCTSNDDCSSAASPDSVCAPFVTPAGTLVDLCTWPIDDVAQKCASDDDCTDPATCNENGECQIGTTSTTSFTTLPDNWCLMVDTQGGVVQQDCPFGLPCGSHRPCPYIDGDGDAFTVYTCVGC